MRARRSAAGRLGSDRRRAPDGRAQIPSFPLLTDQLEVAFAATNAAQPLPAASMVEPFSGTIIETRKGSAVRGRGVAEQKTALAALFGALAEAVPPAV